MSRWAIKHIYARYFHTKGPPRLTAFPHTFTDPLLVRVRRRVYQCGSFCALPVRNFAVWLLVDNEVPLKSRTLEDNVEIVYYFS